MQHHRPFQTLGTRSPSLLAPGQIKIELCLIYLRSANKWYRIKLTTAAPQSHTLEGILFTADPVINVVVINTYVTPANTVATAASPGDYHVIPVSCVQTFSVLPGADNGKSGNASTLFQIGAVDIEQAKAREEARVAKLKEEERHRGKGVTREAQAIYDSFKRM